MPGRGVQRAADAILRVIRSSAPSGAPERVSIREETIDTVQADGRVTIRGRADVLPTKSRTVRLAPGQRVHVLYRGPRPVLVLGHHWKRAQAGRITARGYAVEELVLVEAATAEPAGARWDVYFRNDQQVTRLNLHTIINADRQTTWSFINFGLNETGVVRVGWGQQDNTFWVMAFAHDGTSPSTSRWWPRFYTFRLSRAEREPAGATPVTATLMALVDLPVFSLPTKYGSYGNVGGTPTLTLATFPYLWSSGIASPIRPLHASEPILDREGRITVVLPYLATNTYGTFAPLPTTEEVAYLFAVRSDASAILWESAVTDAQRASPPFSSLGGSAVATPYTAYALRVLGFAIVEWSPAAKRVAIAWQAIAWHDTNVAPRVLTLVHARRAVFVEDGTTVPVATIQAWTDFQQDASGTLFVEATPARSVLARGTEDPRVLLTGTRSTSVGPEVIEARVELWDGAALTLLALEASDTGALSERPQALRLLPGSTVYAIGEDAPSATAGAWPSAAERGRFTLLAGTRPLDIGRGLPDDAAHRGPLAAWPAALTAPDGVSGADRIAYHTAGTVT